MLVVCAYDFSTYLDVLKITILAPIWMSILKITILAPIWVHVLLHFCMRYTNGTRAYTAMIHVVFLEERVTITFLIVFMVVLKQVGLRVCFNNVFVSVLQCCMSP